jgi:hypothetical protein
VPFFYRVYGIGVQSDTSIPGLDSCAFESSENNLQFESGVTPEWVRRGLQLDARILVHRPTEEGTADPAFLLKEYGDGECYELSYADGTTFLVNGVADRAWGAVQPPLTHEDLATYFLGPVLGFVLRQRHVTCLHASAVELHGHAVLFCGDAGYGKSTMAAALALRGVPVLAEDIAALQLAGGPIQVLPGYPRVCLWPEAVQHLLGEVEALPKLTSTWEKRYLPLDGAGVKFAAEKKPLGLVYLFGERSPAPNAPRIEDLAPRDALLELVQKTYMNRYLDRQRRAEEFDDLSKVVRHVPVRRVISHQDAQKIGELCELILLDTKKLLGGVRV